MMIDQTSNKRTSAELIEGGVLVASTR
ncbi:uncharacterized protein METZ01_LOCUS120403 [marine metagenome]|uniref:Uncharacterized protein n=1 Tax=marine metagenome TaxID=408172 RepID=A0A381XS10_9ZZZZ